jgi:hypothetical protein
LLVHLLSTFPFAAAINNFKYVVGKKNPATKESDASGVAWSKNRQSLMKEY